MLAFRIAAKTALTKVLVFVVFRAWAKKQSRKHMAKGDEIKRRSRTNFVASGAGEIQQQCKKSRDAKDQKLVRRAAVRPHCFPYADLQLTY